MLAVLAGLVLQFTGLIRRDLVPATAFLTAVALAVDAN
jgi:hypothetical protein